MEKYIEIWFTPSSFQRKIGEKGVIQMHYSIIVCRSLTYAQRAAAILERRGIQAHFQRTPTELSVGGCSYSVKLSQKKLSDALAALHHAGVTPEAAYSISDDGRYREVSL